jgi:hypothetical protein
MSDGAGPPDWAALEAELDAWAAAGLRATIWWRDDDAASDSPALRRLLDLAAATGAPLALAAIPAKVEAGLAELLAAHAADTTVLQHGYAHQNHAEPGDKKCELVSPARRPAVLDELRRGRERLTVLFGDRFLPVLVPPWNRLDPGLAARLPGLGFCGLSTFKPRRTAEAAPGLIQVNCHLDLLQWKPARRFLGGAAALALLTGHLLARRQGRADPQEPSGLLGHHLVQDAETWVFLTALLDRLNRHPAAALLGAAEIFAGPAGVTPARQAAP